MCRAEHEDVQYIYNQDGGIETVYGGRYQPQRGWLGDAWATVVTWACDWLVRWITR